MKKAFTLAEVLITLGIIGVVAAITMPGLINDYQKKVYETANLVFENRLGEALRQMNIAEELTGLGTTEKFIDNLQKYMKIIQRCNAPDAYKCFADKIGASGDSVETSIIKTSDSFVGGAINWDTEVVGIVLQNGTSALLAYNPNCTSPGIAATAEDLRPCIAITYDTNGKKSPNEYGKDLSGDMAGKAFWVKISDTLTISAADIAYDPVDKNWWQGATNACAAIDGTLPSCGLSGSTANLERFCQNTGAHQSTQACELYNYCKVSGTCSDIYWLKEAGKSSNCSGGSASFTVGTPNTLSGYVGRLYTWCTDRTSATVTNGIIPKARCVKSP